MKKSLLRFICIIAALSTIIGSNVAAEEKVFPSKPIEFVVASPPGGSADQLMRMMKNIMEKRKLVTEAPITIVNKPGGAGLVAASYLDKREGDGHLMFIVNNLIFLNDLYGRTDKNYAEKVTPLATLISEYCAVGVRSDSKFKAPADLIAALKKDPKSVIIGVPNQGSDHHLHMIMLAMKLGIDPKELKIVPYNGAGTMIPAILGGHVDVMAVGPGSISELVRGGKLRYLAIAAPERLKDDTSDVPTWKENGIDLLFPRWKGVIGPPNMPANSIAWWENKLGELTKTPEWQAILKGQGWEDFYMNQHDTAEYFKQDYLNLKELVKSAGLSKEKK